MIRVLALAGGLLLALCACEDNEHPFGDTWGISCAVDGSPSMVAIFTQPRKLDDHGNRREYLGRVEVYGPDFPDIWIWDVGVDLRDGVAESLALERVPIPEEYLGPDGFRPITLDVETYHEAPDTTSASMTGTCSWDGASGELSMQQADDCDLCFDCDHTGAPASAAPVVLLALLGLSRRGQGTSDARRRNSDTP